MQCQSSSRAYPIRASWFVLAVSCAFFGCGGDEIQQWPDNSKDYHRIVAKRGMARVWEVLVSIENVPDVEIQYSDEGTYGTEPGTADATATLQMADVTLQLKAASGQNEFDLIVNSKNMGKIRPGNRLRIAADRTVLVNDKLREPK